MTEPLGLSIGMTNLVAARVGRPPATRRSILTVYPDRAPEVGVPTGGQHPGLVLSGFVDRVGDPVPLVAADGSAHRGEVVLAEALAAMARLVDGGSPVAIAVPAHWGPATLGALRGALRSRPILAPDGVPAALIPDASAALAALQAAPGLPDHGVVVLVDLGGSGTSVTLADAGSNLDLVGQTIRYPDFSGDAVDQLLLDHVLAGIAEANEADPAGTAAVGSLARLRDECRKAKEQLSEQTAAVVPAELPGFRSDVRVTRPELEQLIAEPLGGLLGVIDDALQRAAVPVADVAAVATVGGGAAIPVVTQRLSERLRAPVITTPEPALNVAAGAALVANQSLDAQAATGLAPAAGEPTAMAPAAWAAGAAGLAAGEAADDGAASATFRALAWSQDDDLGSEPVPYTGADYVSSAGANAPDPARPPVAFAPEDDRYDDGPAPLAWYKRPPVLFGIAAAAALLAAGGLAITLTSSDGDPGTVTETATPPAASSPVELPPPVTTVTIGPDGVATTTVSQPPPPPPPSTTDTTAPSSTTTTSPTTTTTTSTTTSTTTTTTPPTTTTTRTTTTRPTTTQPPTTTAAPPTTTAAPATTQAPPVTTTVVPDAGA
ncbi:Hsp70 family protein [Mycolicibacterium sp. 018/SC-01/001]|uniref:Hsp70 family protein n=1 Tax=Mycolicibacterium sp. 018/SC-01/001 TaxID=2592069 RepID=UPI00117EA863|nr:Hsp70 family protein [Mycolicibacterium sp. 018/SC-01/001]TRW77878.1 Hsp70 family protein [Mycolicibacterium sp. 018/SC-01/001]